MTNTFIRVVTPNRISQEKWILKGIKLAGESNLEASSSIEVDCLFIID